MKRFILCAAAVLLVVAAPAPAQTPDDDLREEVEALKKGQEQMRRDLEEIKQLIRAGNTRAARPAGPDVANKVFDLGSNPVKGDKDAVLTLVEFTDFQCGYCARHHRQTYPRIVEEYVDTGKLRYASLDLPLENIHKLAFKAAEAAECAGEQGSYWEMHDRLFENQRALEPWSGHAEALGLDVASFEACLESGRHAEGVRMDMVEARKAGASGTPSFVLARTNPDDPTKVTGLSFIRGAQPFDVFKRSIDEALGASE